MKFLIPILALCLSACATRKAVKPEPVAIPGTSVSLRKMPSVRTPEVVKAYPAGRYTDPNYPDEMHERHTVYRREQSPDWNYLPDPPVALPLGPAMATSNPSPSYYAKAEGELNAQQRAFAEALQEQNRAMKKRIEALQQEAGKVQGLEQEIDRLKKQIDDTPEPPADAPSQPVPAKPEEDDVFSSVEPELPAWEEGVSNPGEIVLFADTDDWSQAFLISQMRLNDEFAAELAAAERRKVSAVFAPFLRRKELALLNQ